MTVSLPAQISFERWNERYTELVAGGMEEPDYGGPLARHVEDGDLRLPRLLYDNGPASLRLWNFLLTEEDRLRAARESGVRIVGTMKDLGTVPVMAYALPDTIAFYPDGSWWIPCIMELSAGLLSIADRLGVDESFCPVRAMLGAFVTEAHFPTPDLLVCSTGAVCDDFSAIAQRVEGLGHPILWWEIPHRRAAAPGEEAVPLPGTFQAARSQIDLVRGELKRVGRALEELSGYDLNDERLRNGIDQANRIRRLLDRLRTLVYQADPCPLPALEMLIAEVLAIHFCSDRAECERVLSALLAQVEARIELVQGVLPKGAVRIFWINPVADLRAMNLLEDCGGRLCGSEFLFSHALDPIPTEIDPWEALARSALADPMVGSIQDRGERILQDIQRFGAEAVILSRIPGASHCALEGTLLRDIIHRQSDIPVLEIEVPPVIDGMEGALRTRLEALIETSRERRLHDLRRH